MAKAGIVYAGTDDGIVIFSDPGGIGSWRRVGHELRGHAIHAILAQSPRELLLAVEGRGVQRSTDGGQHWQQVLAADVWAIAALPSAPEKTYAATRNGDVQCSDDYGQSWYACPQPVDTNVAEPVYLLAIPSTPEQLVYASGDKVWTSTDAGTNWRQFGTAFLEKITGLVASPTRVDTMFISAGGLIYRATETGEWQQVDMFAGGVCYDIELAMLPGKQEVLLAALSASDNVMFVRSDSNGTSWQIAQVADALNGMVTIIAPASYHMDTAWAGTASGQLLRSDDRGRTWAQIAADEAAIRSLAVVRVM